VSELDAARIFWGLSSVLHARTRTSPHRAAPVRVGGLERRRGGGPEGAQPSTTCRDRRQRKLPAVPERPDTITVALSAGDITLSWDTRRALLARLQHVSESSSLRAMFEAVGATRPVELNPAQRATLLGLLDEWTLEDETLPADLIELRNKLSEDLADLA